MNQTPQCPNCSVPTEPGFLASEGHTQAHRTRWCRGQPDDTFWGSETKSRQWREGAFVVTFRCPACGRLDSYANSPS